MDSLDVYTSWSSKELHTKSLILWKRVLFHDVLLGIHPSRWVDGHLADMKIHTGLRGCWSLDSSKQAHLKKVRSKTAWNDAPMLPLIWWNEFFKNQNTQDPLGCRGIMLDPWILGPYFVSLPTSIKEMQIRGPRQTGPNTSVHVNCPIPYLSRSEVRKLFHEWVSWEARRTNWYLGSRLCSFADTSEKAFDS